MKRELKKPQSWLSVGIDIGADFSYMAIAMPDGTFIGKPFRIIHEDPKSRELAVRRIKEAQELYHLESRCFLESTGIYHIPLLRYLKDRDLTVQSLILSLPKVTQVYLYAKFIMINSIPRKLPHLDLTEI